MSVQVFSKTGNKSQSKVTLPKKVFSVEVKDQELLKQVYLASKSNARSNVAKTKTRGEIRGGGRKPWRQKGTGRARFGSIRNPIWRGGGIVFGPRAEENYSKKTNAVSRKLALAQALTLAAKADRVSVIDSFESKDGKTTQTAKLLAKMDLAGNQTLLIVDQYDDKARRAVSNIPSLRVKSARTVSTADVLDSGQLVIDKDSLATLQERIAGGKS